MTSGQGARLTKKLISNHQEFSSAFFFVFYKTSTSLKIANEKDSASMSYHQTRSNRFKLSVQ